MKKFFVILLMFLYGLNSTEAVVLNLYYKAVTKRNPKLPVYWRLVVYKDRANFHGSGYTVLKRAKLFESKLFESDPHHERHLYLKFAGVNKMDGTLRYTTQDQSTYIFKGDFSRLRTVSSADHWNPDEIYELIDYDIHYVGDSEWFVAPDLNIHIRTAKQARADSIRQAGK